MQLVVAIIVVIIIYILQQKLYLRLWDKGLDIDISFHDDYVNVGEKSYLTEVINNDKFLPMPVFHVKFSTSRSFEFDDYENTSVTDAYHRNDVFSVMGNQKITRKLCFKAMKRGYYSIDSINIIAKDFFMTRTFAATVDNMTSIYVFPKKQKGIDLEAACNTIIGDLEIRRNLIEDPYIFTGIREYDRGDSLNRVNWKATARTNDLMVNVYGYSSEQQIKILLNMETNSIIKTEYLQEIAIELASSMAQYFIAKNVPVGIESNANDIVTGKVNSVKCGSSANHMITIDKYLSRLTGNNGIEDFLAIVSSSINNDYSSVSYVVISSYYRDDLLVKLDYLIKSGKSVCMLVPYLNINKPAFSRPYMYGWEVRLDEA